MAAGKTPLLRLARRTGAKAVRQTRKIGLAVEHHVPGLLILQHVLHELSDEGGQTLVDGRDPFLFSRSEGRTSPHECQMRALHKP